MLSHNQLREERETQHKKVTKYLWWAFGGTILIGLITILILSNQDLPTFEQLENPKDNWASEVYFTNGESIGRYFVENRVPVDFEDLNPHLINALISTEDERYYNHSGIDAKALGRVFVKTILLGKGSSGGGSTITQQLAKLLYSDRNFSGMNKVQKIFALGSRKIKEWISAVKLEKSYTKGEILAMYLNHFNFINDAYGIRAASEIYFGKNQEDLPLEEAATLVGMLKNPSLYNPKRFPEYSQNRRNVVLSQMLNKDHIDRATYDSLKIQAIDMSAFKRSTHSDGPAPYFRMVLRTALPNLLNKPECRKPDGTTYDIYRDGLKIYTSLDPNIQKLMEESVTAHMPNIQKRFWRTWRERDPWTYIDPLDEDTEERKENKLRIRARTLERLMEETDRFKSLHENYLKEILPTVEEKYFGGSSLLIHHIKRLIIADQDKSYITQLISQKTIDSGIGSAYRSILKSEEWPELKKQWNALIDQVEKDFNRNIKMKVFTYENPEMIKDTTMSPLDSIKYHRMFLQIGSLAVDPANGHVKAWVGGINHKYYKFDHVTTNRLVGSTFKPFIYATAISHQGISPCQEFYDIPFTISPGDKSFNLIEPWSPANASGKFTGELYTLKNGLKYSKNSISVQLMYELGDTEPVRELVHNMGLDKNARLSNGQYKIPKQPSICLGSTDLSVIEMTGAYTTFANNGVYNKPVFITRIEDREGRLIYEAIPEEKVALNPKHNYVMVELLRNATSGSAGFSGIKSTFGGKTGTTNDYVDGWFMGITPDLVIGTWVGGEDNWIRFLSLADGSGSKMARPYFAEVLRRLETDSLSDFNVKSRFVRPSGNLGIELDCDQYKQEGVDELEEEETDFYEDIYADEEETL